MCFLPIRESNPGLPCGKKGYSLLYYTKEDGITKAPNKWKMLFFNRSEFDNLEKILRRPPETRLKEPEKLHQETMCEV